MASRPQSSEMGDFFVSRHTSTYQRQYSQLSSGYTGKTIPDPENACPD